MAVGAVQAIGADVVGFARADRVVFPISRRQRADLDAAAGAGRAAETMLISADALLGVPRDVPVEHAARLLAPGLVARVLFSQLAPVGAGDSVRLSVEPGIGRAVLAAWARYLGAVVVEDGQSDATALDEAAVRTARSIAFRRGHLQVGSADVFSVIRQGALDAVLADGADTRAAA
jgi:NADPH:quinone reductase-like Zn-dependent oxidoreductase